MSGILSAVPPSALAAMSLRKPPTMTPARIEANRRNARKSTGPRSVRGKAQSRINGLRSGNRSRLYRDVMMTLADAPPCAVDKTARAVLTPEQAAHPMFRELVGLFRQAEIELVQETWRPPVGKAGKIKCFFTTKA
jgi:hypothetical protein